MSFNIQSSLFGSSKAGRFGNQFFQLLFFHIMSEKLDCIIRLPAWNDQLVFENHQFDDPIPVDEVYNLELVYSRSDGPESTIDLINPLLNLFPDKLDIAGSFQFNTNTLYKFRNILDDKFFYTSLANSIKAELNELKKYADLICIHWREGDYNDFNNQHPYFWKADASKLLIAIKKILDITGNRGKVYLASDNPENIINFLENEGIKIISSKNFTVNTNEFFLWDFIALVNSDILIAANSSMSLAAALLNSNGKIFVRAFSPTGEFILFTPWQTEILINQFK